MFRDKPVLEDDSPMHQYSGLLMYVHDLNYRTSPWYFATLIDLDRDMPDLFRLLDRQGFDEGLRPKRYRIGNAAAEDEARQVVSPFACVLVDQSPRFLEELAVNLTSQCAELRVLGRYQPYEIMSARHQSLEVGPSFFKAISGNARATLKEMNRIPFPSTLPPDVPDGELGPSLLAGMRSLMLQVGGELYKCLLVFVLLNFRHFSTIKV